MARCCPAGGLPVVRHLTGLCQRPRHRAAVHIEELSLHATVLAFAERLANPPVF